MKVPARTARVEADIIRLAHSGLDSVSLRRQVMERLRHEVAIDAYGFATVDPATMMFTGSVQENIPENAIPRLAKNEFAEEDVAKFAELVVRRQPVARLSDVTHGQLTASRRYREIHTPLGWGDEMRAVFVSSELCWGFLCMHRERSAPEFSSIEAAFVARLTAHLAEGLRKSLLVASLATAAAEERGPGLVELTDDLDIAAMNTAAESWFADVADEDCNRHPRLPHAVYAVVSHLRALETATTPMSGVPRLRVRARSGQWLTFHATRLRGSDTERTAVIIEPLTQPEIAPVIVQVHGLSKREGDVCLLAMRGYSTADIAERLLISSHTVQDHLKSIFDKVGVRSRRELVGQMFFQHYWPQHESRLRRSTSAH